MDRRYIRQYSIPEIGEVGQKRISSGSVFIVGAGALGSVVASYLAGAGVGRIGIADFDTVDISNLQRQVFYTESALGKRKVEVIANHLRSVNSEIDITGHSELITRSRGLEIFPHYDVIVDATDNPSSKYMTDEVCDEVGRPCVIGGVEQFRGQLTTILPGSVRYRELFPDAGDEQGVTPCSVAGVIGPAAGTGGSLQAAEVIKLLSGAGEVLDGRLLSFNLLNNDWHVFEF